jgi:uncharacterized membrane protein
MKNKKKLVRLVLLALFSALIIAMTFTPYTGYISVGIIEITTLHIVVIIGAAILGAKNGAILGGVWGITCIVRAIQMGFIPFINPFVSLVPRILVGVVAGLVLLGLSKTKLPKPISLIITALAGSITNTVCVLSALKLCDDIKIVHGDIQFILGKSDFLIKAGEISFNGFEALFGEGAKTVEVIIGALISINGLIELAAALLLVPSIYMATHKIIKDKI